LVFSERERCSRLPYAVARSSEVCLSSVSEHDTTQVLLLLFLYFIEQTNINAACITVRSSRSSTFASHQRLPVRLSWTTGHARCIT